MEPLWMTKFSRDSLIIFTLGLGLVSLSSATETTCNGYKIFSLGSLSEWEYSWRPHVEMFAWSKSVRSLPGIMCEGKQFDTADQ